MDFPLGQPRLPLFLYESSSQVISSGLAAGAPEGGNQGELAHQKKMKKSQEINKGKRKEDSLTALRQQRVSEIMQQKQKEANEKKSMQTREK
ncbi:small EDRK-rich factor 1-like [Equus przewalskii]|uniref:Small EDRK-rich factor 1-like n=1 Tax=Equus przewalskii TaxID=9798 RepID=A0ABM4KCW5_EQUPR